MLRIVARDAISLYISKIEDTYLQDIAYLKGLEAETTRNKTEYIKKCYPRGITNRAIVLRASRCFRVAAD